MKSLKTIAFAAVTLALTGCFAEDYSFCPPEVPVENVTLNFRLPTGPGEACTFLDNVQSASTAIYNQNGDLIQLIETTDAHHREFQGIKTTLEPGEYRVISWGNAGGYTDHNNTDYHYRPGTNANVSYKTVTDGCVGNCDALYYAPNTVDHHHGNTRVGTGHGNEAGEYEMTVSQLGHVGTLDFRHAHRVVNVYVRNFNDGQGNTTPTVRLTDIPDGLNFGGMSLIQGGQKVNAELSSEMVTVDGKQYAMASFNTFLFHLMDTESDVELLHPSTGEVVYTAHIHDVHDPAADDPDSTDPVEIVIEFFGDTAVEVTIPDWDPEEVDYGTGKGR